MMGPVGKRKCCPAFCMIVACIGALGCAGRGESSKRFTESEPSGKVIGAIREAGGVALGEPLALSVDFQGNIYVGDGIPGRVVWFDSSGKLGLEFQAPAGSPGFYPSDVKLKDFFVYVLDEVNRKVVRFDRSGTYRDVLINFADEIGGERTSPSGFDVDRSGRIAVSDEENHRVLLFDAYLSLEMVFGTYGSHEGRLNSPQGVSFSSNSRLLVADTGNGRIQVFDGGGSFIRTVPVDAKDNPLRAPRRVVEDREGRLYVADPEAGAVFVFDVEGRALLSLRPGDGVEFRPTDVEIVSERVLYVTDTAGRAVFLFRVM